MKLSSMQKAFWRDSTHRWNIKEGATRSGKTYLDYFVIPKRILEYKDKEGLKVIIGNTQMTIERNILEPMRKIYGPSHIGEIKRGSNTVTIFGEKVYALGADKASQVTKFQGSGIAYCYGDEIATWSEDVFQMLKSRLSYPYSKFDGTCNPDSPEHWFKKFLDSDADIYRQSYTIYDNPFLADEVVRNLELEYKNTVFFDRYILGKWALAEGRVYSGFDPERDPIKEVPEDLTGRFCVSVDYGTSNPCVFLKWEEGKSGTWYLTDEYYYSGRDKHRQKTDEEYITDFQRFLDGREPYRVIVDPSAASFIAALKKKGYSVRKAKNDVLNGIRFTATRLSTGKIKILKTCKHTLSEFSAYSWDDSKGQDVPIKEHDHCMDAMRYFTYTIIRRMENSVLTKYK